MASPEEDPGISKDLEVQCDAPPEFPTADDPAEGASGQEAKGASGQEAEGASGQEAEGVSGQDSEDASGQDSEGASGQDYEGASGQDSDGPASCEAKRAVMKSWEDAIASENVEGLLQTLRNGSCEVVHLERAGQRRGRTALLIAAKSNHPDIAFELAKEILDQLIKSRREKYTDKIFDLLGPGGTRNFGTIGEYIRAIEDNSKETAIELAKVKNPLIVAYIEDIQKCRAAHAKIDRGVQKSEDLWYGNPDDFKKYILDFGGDDVQMWLRDAIASRDCKYLMKVVKDLPSSPTEDLWEDAFWKCEGESGRTMLHVAAMQGCFPLAKLLLDRAKVMKDRDYVIAVDDLSGLTALQMANDIIGNSSIAEYVKYTLKLFEDRGYKHPCFFEAYPRTEWCMALSSGDVSELQSLLEQNHRLLLETYKGRTVLHVAILYRNLKLVKIVLKIFGKEKKVSFGDSYFPSELSWQQMLDKKGEIDKSLFVTRSGTDARSSMRTRANVERRPSSTRLFDGSAMELIQHMTGSEAVKKLLEEYDKALVVQPSDSPEHYISEIDSLNAIFWETWWEDEWKKEWDRGYKADVDFSFEAEPRRTLLKALYACKHPLIFKEFLQVLNSEGEYLKLMRDAQGRTMNHILLDYCQNQDSSPGGWILNEVHGRYVPYIIRDDIKVKDARGRTPDDIFLMKNYLQQNILLKDMDVFTHVHSFSKSSLETEVGNDEHNDIEMEKADYNPMNDNDYALCFMFYHVASVLKQTNVAHDIWSNILEKNPKQFQKELCKSEEVQYIAASTGNQVMLRSLIEKKIDLTITDAEKRTLLHHAVNPTLLRFEVLLKLPMIGHCFSTVKDICEVKKKWNIESNKTSMMFPSRFYPSLGSGKDLDMEKSITSMNMERKACILLLLQEGVDLSQEDENTKVPNLGPANDTTYQSWWYDMVAKDLIDKKNNFNQAANAISVVGTLVAATSYIGPLQPPMSYADDGFLRTKSLIMVFMISNSCAFYLALTSVILAVVPSLPMPQESALLELKRAQHIVASSLLILLFSIISIIFSFGAASMVVIDAQHKFPGVLLFVPTIIGCIFCSFAILSFLARVLRLKYYSSPAIRRMYQISFTI